MRPKILFPELVPLENKGEEAVVRGVADVMFPDAEEPPEIGVLDFVTRPRCVDGITVFPMHWLYSGLYRGSTKSRVNYARPRRLRRTQKLHDYRVLLRVVAGHPGPAACLGRARDAQRQPLLDFFRDAEFVFVGHDGLWGPETYLVLKAAKAAGKFAGMLGTGLPQVPGRLRWIHQLAQRRGVGLADFCVVREANTYQRVRALCPGAEHVMLAPDPAFLLVPDHRRRAEEILAALPGVARARRRNALLVMATVTENSVVFNKSFTSAVSFSERRTIHNRYLARLFDLLIERANAHVVMLPHSHYVAEIDSPAFNNDVQVARGVVAGMQQREAVDILDTALSCRTLKALIREADLLVGERTHSLIASVGVATPFVGLTNTGDHRTQGIITKMCGCEAQMVNLDEMNVEQAWSVVNAVVNDRVGIAQRLEHKSAELSRTLQGTAQWIRDTRERRQLDNPTPGP